MSKPRSGAAKRLGVGLLAGALSVASIALVAPSAGATADVTVIRYAGTDRYGTAAAIAGDSAFDGATHAIVATGENYPDALAASAFAGANAPTPIILTQTNTYTASAKSALADAGVDDVTIVGGTAAVSTTVENAIKGDGYAVTRQAGTDRYGTAAAIAKATNADQAGTAVGGKKTALIATGLNFPDALSGGPAAYSDTLPLLLVGSDVPAVTKSALQDMGIQQVVILGGTAAVSDAVETSLEGIVGNPAIRAAGTDRYGTATAFADWEKSALGYTPTAVVAATGLNFPDALASGPLGGEHEAPIVLTASCPVPTTDWLKANADTIATLFITGGTAAVDQATQTCLTEALKGTGNATATDRPELVSASIVKTVKTGTLTNPAGTTVRYVFDESVTNPTNSDFELIFSDASRDQADGDAVVNQSNDKAVDVLFTSYTEAGDLSGVTMGGAMFGAVEDTSSDNLDSIEGSAPLTVSGGAAVTAHKTTAPDLLQMTRVGDPCESCAVNQRAIDLTFDQAAYTTGTGNYVEAILTDGANVTCYLPDSGDTTASGGGDPGGDGTTTLTALCDQVQDDDSSSTFTAVSTSNVARVVIPDGQVSNADNSVQNVTQATTSPDGDATTLPDLTGVTFTHGTSHDTAVFTFDRSVTVNNSGQFYAYDSSAGFINPNADAFILGNSNKSVEVHFDSGDLDQAVGGIVYSGGVISSSGLDPQTNEDDEEGATTTGAAAATAGSTSAPDLTAVLVVTSKDSFGNASDVNLVFTFDENIDATGGQVQGGSAGYFWGWTANGDGAACVYAATTDDSDQVPANSVTCSTANGTVRWDMIRGTQGTHASNTALTLAEAQTLVAGSIADDAVCDSGGNCSPEAERVASKLSV